MYPRPISARMKRLNPRILTLLALATSTVPSVWAQAPVIDVPGSGGFPIHAEVLGTVTDLTPRGNGDILYCTEEGHVGTFQSDGSTTLLADAASGPFPFPLRGIVETAAGDVAVLDREGHIYTLVGGGTPAVQTYQDIHMIQDATDMVVDAGGNFIITSDTPSPGVRGVNWISPDGMRWAYLVVENAPVSLANDPVTGGILASDEEGTGSLRLIDTSNKTYPSAILEELTAYGFDSDREEGDLAVDLYGNVYAVAQGTVFRFNRASGTTTVLGQGFAQLRAVAIGDASGNAPSRSDKGASLYVAEGSNPTRIVEIPGVDIGASTTVVDLGTVPNRGQQRLFFTGGRVYDLALDNAGDLLIGGDLWGSNPSVRRVDTTNFSISLIANSSNGISGRIEGIAVAADDTIFAVTIDGVIHRIRENPLSVTTIFSDPMNQITAAKDLVLKDDGTLFVGDREGFGPGEVLSISNGVATTVLDRSEAKGLTAHPLGAQLLSSQWNDVGFCGSILSIPMTDPGNWSFVPGFEGLNYSNAVAWSDGDMVGDAMGNIYTTSEDDWRTVKWNPTDQRYEIVGSSYFNHPSGLVITNSSAGSGSTTGWSLYMSEFDFLWEIPDAAPPGRTTVACPTQITTTSAPRGFFPRGDVPSAVIPDPEGAGLLVTTESSQLARFLPATGSVEVLADSLDGLSGELVALAATPSGSVVVANREGVLFDVDPGTGYSVETLYDGEGLGDVTGLTIDAQGSVLVLDRDPAAPTSRLFRFDGSTLEWMAHTNRGLKPAIDPLTGEVFVTERGNPTDGGGEILRVDASQSPAATGHLALARFETFSFGDGDGDLTFDAQGNLYLTAGDTQWVEKIDRATGERTRLAAYLEDLKSLTLAPASDGQGGTNLYALAGWVIHEIELEGVSPAPLALLRPDQAKPADLRVVGRAAPGATVQVIAQSPEHAGKLYLIVPTLQGKSPGLALSVLRDGSDTRVIPNNSMLRWKSQLAMGTQGFLGFLDSSGRSRADTALVIPNDLSILGWNTFLDLSWVVIDSQAQNRIAKVGGTAQLYLGQ